MKEYKRCLNAIRTYLNDETLRLNEKKLDELVDKELDKPVEKMDPDLIDLCLNALVAYRSYMSKNENNR